VAKEADMSALASLVIAHAKRLAGDESGATSIEYAVIASMIAVVIAAAVGILGTTVLSNYELVQTALETLK
jgi:pilus assembly protein Flp/PilA